MIGPNSRPIRAAALGLQREHADAARAPRAAAHRARIAATGALMPFERAQHRDRRRDRAVAVEQRRAENADRDDADALAVLDAEERHQRENAALAVVVGAHDDGHVLDRRGDDERPDDEREHAERDVRRGRAARPVERGLEGVERARADVAVDDAERAERHRGEAAGRRSGIRWLGRDRQRVLPVDDAVGRLGLARRRSDAGFSFRSTDAASRHFVLIRRRAGERRSGSAGLTITRHPGNCRRRPFCDTMEVSDSL